MVASRDGLWPEITPDFRARSFHPQTRFHRRSDAPTWIRRYGRLCRLAGSGVVGAHMIQIALWDTYHPALRGASLVVGFDGLLRAAERSS